MFQFIKSLFGNTGVGDQNQEPQTQEKPSTPERQVPPLEAMFAATKGRRFTCPPDDGTT